MSNPLDYVFEEHRVNFLKLYKMLQNQNPILLFDVQAQQIFAYPYHEFKAEMSSKSQAVLEEQYPHVLAGTHIMAFVRDNEQRRLVSRLIEIDPDEFERTDTKEIVQVPPNNAGLKIDNYLQVMELINKMKAALPIPTSPTPDMKMSLSNQGLKNMDQTLQISDVVYMGDEAGISCQIESLGKNASVFMISLTHLTVDSLHPLAEEIKAYQITRRKKLLQSNQGKKTGSAKIRPRKNRKRKKKTKKRKR